MCDTIVTVPPAATGSVWFAKNSDREPGESQVVELVQGGTHSPAESVSCTYLSVPQSSHTFSVLISRPFWMWGAEIGVNEHGVAIGNEAVFTRLPVADTGLTGMDLLRLALERSDSARGALDTVTGLLAEYGQGGVCGYRNRKFRYHNSYVIADPAEAWVLETADRHWVAQRVTGTRTISNFLSIGSDFDLVSPAAFEYARERGWCRAAADFNFARCYGDARFRMLTGGVQRAACTLDSLRRNAATPKRDSLIAALTDHAGHSPEGGWRMQMPCAHSSWWPTRRAGQTTSSMIARLTADSPTAWVTGTSSPCISIFKPVTVHSEARLSTPQPGGGYDGDSLFWQHERLHRLILPEYEERRALIEGERRKLQSMIDTDFGGNRTAAEISHYWREHTEAVHKWIRVVAEAATAARTSSAFQRYWADQNRLDHLS